MKFKAFISLLVIATMLCPAGLAEEGYDSQVVFSEEGGDLHTDCAITFEESAEPNSPNTANEVVDADAHGNDTTDPGANDAADPAGDNAADPSANSASDPGVEENADSDQEIIAELVDEVVMEASDVDLSEAMEGIVSVENQRFISTGIASYKGTVGQQRVQPDVIKNYLVPVAPYAEQQRIVEKIDQAFSVLDTIDALQAQYADNLAVLKAKLIDAAIQGKLTEQLPEDGTAEELYQQIQAEKQVLIKAGKIKKEKPLSGIKDEEIPFAIPDNWEWVRFAGITNIVGTGMIRTGNEQFDKAEYYYA